MVGANQILGRGDFLPFRNPPPPMLKKMSIIREGGGIVHFPLFFLLHPSFPLFSFFPLMMRKKMKRRYLSTRVYYSQCPHRPTGDRSRKTVSRIPGFNFKFSGTRESESAWWLAGCRVRPPPLPPRARRQLAKSGC